MKTTYQDFIIRSWEARDRESAANLIRDVLGEYGLPWQPDTADRDVIAIEDCYLVPGGEFWVVERDNTIVGTAAYYPIERGDRAVEIRKMYLSPTVRGQGLGKFLLHTLETAIQQRGFREIWIETASVLTEAVQLYEKSSYLPATGVETARCDRVYVKQF
jgi:putative acetyltransferase